MNSRSEIPNPQLKARDRILDLSRPIIMGILNVTPDSFSDGGQYFEPARAVEHGLRMVEEGAAIIDIGGESTRPGSAPVPEDEQIRRTVPVIAGLLRQADLAISIDTTSGAVARAALEAGAGIINDISALRFDPEMLPLAARTQAAVILMHMLGTPSTMQQAPTYGDVVAEVRDFLAQRLAYAQAQGIPPERLVIDPGIGFGKTLEHNLLLLRHLDELARLHPLLLVGPSRKAFLGMILDAPDPERRLMGTAAACAWSLLHGARILRVHDVREIAQLARVLDSILDFRF